MSYRMVTPPVLVPTGNWMPCDLCFDPLLAHGFAVGCLMPDCPCKETYPSPRYNVAAGITLPGWYEKEDWITPWMKLEYEYRRVRGGE